MSKVKSNSLGEDLSNLSRVPLPYYLLGKIEEFRELLDTHTLERPCNQDITHLASGVCGILSEVLVAMGLVPT